MMGVLEITLLQLKTELTDSVLLANLRSIRSQLGTNSRFFATRNHQHDHWSILILGVWSTLQAHYDFLNSDDRDKVLGPQEDQTSFTWGLHVDLGPGRDMDALDLDTRQGLSLTLLSSNSDPDGEELVLSASREHLNQVVSKTNGQQHVIVNAWRMDAAEGMKERVVIVGRDDLTIAKDKFSNRRTTPGAEQTLVDVSVAEEIGFDLENDEMRMSALTKV